MANFPSASVIYPKGTHKSRILSDQLIFVAPPISFFHQMTTGIVQALSIDQDNRTITCNRTRRWSSVGFPAHFSCQVFHSTMRLKASQRNGSYDSTLYLEKVFVLFGSKPSRSFLRVICARNLFNQADQ